jgi:hypothetical protein
MPMEQVPDSTLTYYLVSLDKSGRERDDGPGGQKLSERLLADLAAQPITDVFLISHGWKGDVPAAREQYNRWIPAMLGCTGDIERLRARRPAFRPMLIGLHWPSLPFGDEELGGAAFDSSALSTVDGLIETYADRVADTLAARAALRTIFEAAFVDNEPAELPPAVADAYRTLNRESGLASNGEGSSPGADREPFDPQAAYQNARASAAEEALGFGGFSLSGLLSPLRQLSFWQMKDRARSIGEAGGHTLLRQIQTTAPAARVHLMGHSFGCIVTSAMIAGQGGKGVLPRPVDTLFLVQGALSLWSYCSTIEAARGVAGYFRSILADRRVSGVLLATTSEFDTAVGRYYPLGAGVAKQTSFGEPPKYGGLGTFGVQGPDTNASLIDMLPVNKDYAFQPGCVYNVNGSEYIRNGSGASGAHSDIAHPEVAHAYWAAVISRR